MSCSRLLPSTWTRSGVSGQPSVQAATTSTVAKRPLFSMPPHRVTLSNVASTAAIIV